MFPFVTLWASTFLLTVSSFEPFRHARFRNLRVASHAEPVNLVCFPAVDVGTTPNDNHVVVKDTQGNNLYVMAGDDDDLDNDDVHVMAANANTNNNNTNISTSKPINNNIPVNNNQPIPLQPNPNTGTLNFKQETVTSNSQQDAMTSNSQQEPIAPNTIQSLNRPTPSNEQVISVKEVPVPYLHQQGQLIPFTSQSRMNNKKVNSGTQGPGTNDISNDKQKYLNSEFEKIKEVQLYNQPSVAIEPGGRHRKPSGTGMPSRSGTTRNTENDDPKALDDNSEDEQTTGKNDVPTWVNQQIKNGEKDKKRKKAAPQTRDDEDETLEIIIRRKTKSGETMAATPLSALQNVKHPIILCPCFRKCTDRQNYKVCVESPEKCPCKKSLTKKIMKEHERRYFT